MVNKRFLYCLIIVFTAFSFCSNLAAVDSSRKYEYQLYKNIENFGIVTFPKKYIYPELEQFIQSIKFEPVESGDAVMRFGTDGENSTYMMPQDVQDKYAIKKFIILQILDDKSLLIGIYDPDFGLTLLQRAYQLDEIGENIKETLKIFRRKGSVQEI